MKTRNLLIVFLLILLSGCASMDWAAQEKITMDSWLGSSKTQLLQSWGVPANIASDGQGGEIYTYGITINFGQSAGQVYAGTNRVYYTNPQNMVVTRSRMFFIDQSGKIYHWLCQGKQGY